jgi:WLM domain
MGPLLLFLLIVLSLVSILTTKEPEQFIKVKERYAILRDHIAKNEVPEKFKILENQILLVGYLRKKHELGYNTNKGYEICLCLDGTPNQIFHVLLHELAHSTVPEYDHSTQFWNNFKELRELATQIGIYEPVNTSEKFCGKYISDS